MATHLNLEGQVFVSLRSTTARRIDCNWPRFQPDHARNHTEYLYELERFSLWFVEQVMDLKNSDLFQVLSNLAYVGDELTIRGSASEVNTILDVLDELKRKGGLEDYPDQSEIYKRLKADILRFVRSRVVSFLEPQG